MRTFREIMDHRREQHRYEKRLRDQAMAVYRSQIRMVQEQAFEQLRQFSDTVDSVGFVVAGTKH